MTKRMTNTALRDRIAELLLVRSGGWMQRIRDMPEEKAQGDAEAILSVLGLNDFDAAVERAAQQLGQEARDNRDAGHPWALEMGDRYAAQRVLEAALLSTEGEG